MTLFRRLALATTLTTLGVIGVGGLVRATNSGDGCPSWPKCFGRWVPPLNEHAIIEWSHRAIGAIAITLLCVTLVVAVVRHRRERRIFWPTLLATPGIFLQAILGAIVVSAKTHANYSHYEA
ncbi:MAG: COX15/CtaA family protein, partial [Actinobacteria bacterium]|nr:COX15/CtaA family protein [Actinomycetota bacterium]